MKKLTIVLTLIALLVSSAVLAQTPAPTFDADAIKASSLQDNQKIDLITRLSAAGADTSKVNPLQREFTKLVADAAKTQADQDEAERLEKMYAELSQFFTDNGTTDQCLDKLPAYFLVNGIEPGDQHKCVDAATTRWSKMFGYELTSGTDANSIDHRLATLRTSIKQNQAFDARISARLAKLPNYDKRMDALFTLVTNFNVKTHQRMDEIEGRVSTLETAQLDANKLSADLWDRLSERMKLKGDNEDNVRTDMAWTAAQLRTLGTDDDNTNDND